MRKLSLKRWTVHIALIITLLFAGLSCAIPRIGPPPAQPQPPVVTPAGNPIDPNWKLPSADGRVPFLPSIADVVAKVKPAVVAINTELTTFDIFQGNRTEKGAGSGWILRGDGIVVTNNHVIEGARKITVTLTDGRSFPVDASKVAADPLSDLAVLKVEATNLPSFDLGKSSALRVGDWVVAIGNPLGLGISAKEGIVSRLGVSITLSPGQSLSDLIETSAAINPGNSGGPLVNMAGEVIGITSIKITSAGSGVSAEALGYAISIDTAAPIIEKLINTGYVVRPWLGVVFTDVNQQLVLQYNLSVDKGVFLTQVVAGSPADKAGLKANDVIVGLNGKEINTSQDLVQAIHSAKVGQGVEIVFWRGAEKKTTFATLAKSPPS